MGIAGLLPFLKDSCRRTSLGEFRGQTVAVDASCWLHKGAISCADKLANQEKTDMYVRFCLKYVKLLLSYQMHVIMVFDGASLPAKKRTNEQRTERRKTMKAKGNRLLAEGKYAEAYEYFKQSTEITFDMITDVIRACLNLPDVDCIIAPYESDAQLAYFSTRGIANLVITEDSDLVLFECSNILFKMDINGFGDLYEKMNLYRSFKTPEDKFEFSKFRRCCILAGCDYFPGLEGVGLVKAIKFFKKTSRDDLKKILPMIGVYLRISSVKVDKTFIDNFIHAEHTFMHQPVFDVQSKLRIPLTPRVGNELPDLYETEKAISPCIALNLAVGNINPNTGVNINAFKPRICNRSIWNQNFSSQNFVNVTLNDGTLSQQSVKMQNSSFESTPSRIVVKRKSENFENKYSIGDKCRPRDAILDEYRLPDLPVISRYFANDTNFRRLSSFDDNHNVSPNGNATDNRSIDLQHRLSSAAALSDTPVLEQLDQSDVIMKDGSTPEQNDEPVSSSFSSSYFSFSSEKRSLRLSTRSARSDSKIVCQQTDKYRENFVEHRTSSQQQSLVDCSSERSTPCSDKNNDEQTSRKDENNSENAFENINTMSLRAEHEKASRIEENMPLIDLTVENDDEEISVTEATLFNRFGFSRQICTKSNNKSLKPKTTTKSTFFGRCKRVGLSKSTAKKE